MKFKIVFFLFLMSIILIWAGDRRTRDTRGETMRFLDEESAQNIIIADDSQEREKKSIEEKRKMAEEFYEKGLMAKELSEKEKFYLKAIEILPNYAEAHNNLGDVYEKQGRFENAIKEYTIASILLPEKELPYFGLGDVYFKMGRWEMAIKYYEKGLKIKPDDKESLENLELAKALNKKILFEFDSDELTEREIEKLKEIAKALTSPKLFDLLFEIQGHTDSTGSEEYNLKLSLRRAERVKKYLVEKEGIKNSRLKVHGYGEDRPIGDNRMKEGRQRNRRVEIGRTLEKILK